MNLIMYSTGCPKCRILKMKLDASKMQYSINDNIDEMLELGFTELPMLSVDGKLYHFAEAVRWVNENLPDEAQKETV